MTAPTHIAFALALGQLAGINPLDLKLLAAGALLPDIDHPQSTIGRLCFFLSIPLNKWYGHRKIVHGFFLWGVLSVVGSVFWKPALFLGLGALSHCFLDCWNVSGVQALEPFSEKVCVLFNRSWRIVTGSRKELAVLLVFGTLAWAGGYIGTCGGIRAVVGEILGSYQIAHERYLREGTKICHIKGKLRTFEGNILEGKWLIIGKEGSRGLALVVEDKILHIPKGGHFLRAKLRVTKDEKWETMKLKGLAETLKPVFVLKKGKWKKAEAGTFVTGVIIGRKIELDLEKDIWEVLE